LETTCQQDGIITKWHGETNKETVLGWHPLAFFCIMEMEFPFTTPQKIKMIKDLEVNKDPNVL
jgi:hypothetical protein